MNTFYLIETEVHSNLFGIRICGRPYIPSLVYSYWPYIPPSVSAGGRVYSPFCCKKYIIKKTASRPYLLTMGSSYSSDAPCNKPTSCDDGGRIYRRPCLRAAVYTAVRICGRPYIPPSVSAGGRIHLPLLMAPGRGVYRRPYLRAAVYTAFRIGGRPFIPSKDVLRSFSSPPHHHHRTTPYNHPTATATSTAAGSHMLIILRIFFKLSRQTPRP